MSWSLHVLKPIITTSEDPTFFFRQLLWVRKIMSHQVSMWRLFRTTTGHWKELAIVYVLRQLKRAVKNCFGWWKLNVIKMIKHKNCISLPPLARSKQMNMPWLKCSRPCPRKTYLNELNRSLCQLWRVFVWDTNNRLIGATTYRIFCSKGYQPEVFWPTGPLHRLLQWLWAAQRFSNLP